CIFFRLIFFFKSMHQIGQGAGRRKGITYKLMLHCKSASQVRPEKWWLTVAQAEAGQDGVLQCLIGKPHGEKHGWELSLGVPWYTSRVSVVFALRHGTGR